MADAIDLDELCGPLGGAHATPSATFRTPPDAQRRVPQWQRQVASDVLSDEEDELRRQDGMLPWHLAQSLTEESQGGMQGGPGQWRWPSLLQSPTEGVAQPLGMQSLTEGLSGSPAVGTRPPALVSSLVARATTLPAAGVQAGCELGRHLEEARRARVGFFTEHDNRAQVPSAGPCLGGQITVPSSSFVSATLANPYASAQDVTSAHGALVLQRCIANGEYPIYSEWRAHVQLLSGQFWLCIRCKVVNRREKPLHIPTSGL